MPRFIPGLAKLPEKKQILRLKSTNGAASTIVANVIGGGGISRNWRCTQGLLTTTKRMQCFALRLRVMGVGKIPPVRL